MSDPVDDFLNRAVPAGRNEPLRDVVRRRTTRLLRRRRHIRRLAYVAALGACFLAGMATMHWLTPATAATTEPAPAPVVAEKEPGPAPAVQPLPRNAAVMELQARSQPDGRAAQLRRAATLYLNEEQNYAAALRCYGDALSAGGSDALAFSLDDDWLEMAIKHARQKEKRQ